MKAKSASFHTIRLVPGQMLREALSAWAKTHKVDAAAITTCVGSLKKAAIRYADSNTTTITEGKYEIVSLTGTLSRHGIHLHISLSHGDGKTIGGHLMDGCEIYTTAEIVLAELEGVVFKRLPDAVTGYLELNVEKKS
ncbi:PPC domain-containing DNA-binding protein [uncultured Imperialibacter sp.]|uniref:PPC domain-containing DNA-binding protein n=1 Tax=uncultured Imperialibacter sp. TaxID=1672639 RepID=UPI0030DAD2EE|tara:strand:- start:24651 stop:25064 length:414 start_codon:yes stop_codon:yes gene_type:complete